MSQAKRHVIRKQSAFRRRLPALVDLTTGRARYCERCEGCGSYEGGKVLLTTCEDCEGTGLVWSEEEGRG